MITRRVTYSEDKVQDKRLMGKVKVSFWNSLVKLIVIHREKVSSFVVGEWKEILKNQLSI